jgi:hypothetical protein
VQIADLVQAVQLRLLSSALLTSPRRCHSAVPRPRFLAPILRDLDPPVQKGNLLKLSKKTDLPLVQLLSTSAGIVQSDISFEEASSAAGLKAIAKYAAGLGPSKDSIRPPTKDGYAGPRPVLAAGLQARRHSRDLRASSQLSARLSRSAAPGDGASACSRNDCSLHRCHPMSNDMLQIVLAEAAGRRVQVHPYTFRNEYVYLKWNWAVDPWKELFAFYEEEQARCLLHIRCCSLFIVPDAAFVGVLARTRRAAAPPGSDGARCCVVRGMQPAACATQVADVCWADA